MTEEKSDQPIVAEPTPTEKTGIFYKKPAIQKHDELTQVTFSSHESPTNKRAKHSHSGRQEVNNAREETRRRENSARGIPND